MAPLTILPISARVAAREKPQRFFHAFRRAHQALPVRILAQRLKDLADLRCDRPCRRSGNDLQRLWFDQPVFSYNARYFTDVSFRLPDADLFECRPVRRKCPAPRFPQPAVHFRSQILGSRHHRPKGRNFLIQIAIAERSQDLLVRQAVQQSRSTTRPVTGSTGPAHRHFDLVVMPVAVRIVAFAEDLAVLLIAQRRRMQPVRREKHIAPLSRTITLRPGTRPIIRCVSCTRTE